MDEDCRDGRPSDRQRYTLTDRTKIVVGEPQTVGGRRVQPSDTQTHLISQHLKLYRLIAPILIAPNIIVPNLTAPKEMLESRTAPKDRSGGDRRRGRPPPLSLASGRPSVDSELVIDTCCAGCINALTRRIEGGGPLV
ncbi:hypothetical protein J6590_028741 [Homalodisca vitripennis]|nr:hypothetical protein J6590_028741 [Homalodisca vitripennis]